MAIKITIASRLSYYFCGSIALSGQNTKENPLVVDLDTLNKQEILGLNRAVKTGVLRVLEGSDELTTKAESFSKTKKKEVTQPIVEVKEVTPVETVETIEPIEEVKETVEVKEEAPVKVAPKTRSTTRTTKSSAKK